MILALDLATVDVGWAVGDGERPSFVGSYTPGAHHALPKRIQLIAKWARGMVLIHKPTLVVAERPDVRPTKYGGRHYTNSGGGNASLQSMMALGHACGALIVVCQDAGVALQFWDAQNVREQLIGRPTASKLDIQAYLTQRYPNWELPLRGPEIDHDGCDAIALWCAVYDRDQWERKTASGAHQEGVRRSRAKRSAPGSGR